MEAPVGDEDNSQLGDFVQDNLAEDPAKSCGGCPSGQICGLLVEQLSERERQVLRQVWDKSNSAP